MIRKATLLDVPAILKLADRYIKEEVSVLGHHSSKWDMDIMARNLVASFADPSEFLWVSVIAGDVVGYMWCAAHYMGPWSSELVSSDYLFYVTPEHRGSLTASRLIRKYLKWSRELGCVEARLSIASGITEERTGKLFEKHGVVRCGSVYKCNFGR